MRRLSILIGLIVVLTPAFNHAPAARASAAQALADCNAKNRLTGQYSVADLSQALTTMSAEIREYTDCYDVIQRTLSAEIGSSHQAGTAGSREGSGSGGFLPTPLLVVLVVLVVGAASFGVVAVRRRR